MFALKNKKALMPEEKKKKERESKYKKKFAIKGTLDEVLKVSVPKKAKATD